MNLTATEAKTAGQQIAGMYGTGAVTVLRAVVGRYGFARLPEGFTAGGLCIINLDTLNVFIASIDSLSLAKRCAAAFSSITEAELQTHLNALPYGTNVFGLIAALELPEAHREAALGLASGWNGTIDELKEAAFLVSR